MGLFGIEEEHADANVIIIDKECQWLDDLYSAYTDWLSGYKLELEKRLLKPYIRENTQQGKILFFCRMRHILLTVSVL